MISPVEVHLRWITEEIEHCICALLDGGEMQFSKGESDLWYKRIFLSPYTAVKPRCQKLPEMQSSIVAKQCFLYPQNFPSSIEVLCSLCLF